LHEKPVAGMESGKPIRLPNAPLQASFGGQSTSMNSAAICAQLEKILTSEVFARADRMSRFLRFVVQETLKGKGAQLKEYLIGVEVFDRGAAYDPRTDPVVRGEARRLRAKLMEYYEHEGKDDAVRIQLPKGSYAVVFQTFNTLSDIVATDPVPTSVRSGTAGAKSIAVLPFLNLSPKPENEYFGDGLTEEIIHALGKVNGMSVVARTSVFQYKGKAYDIRQIGEQLCVQTVLEGSVRTSGDRLRVTAQLVNASDGYHLWSETYDRSMVDLFAIQEELSVAIVNTLRQYWSVPVELPPARRPSSNLEAYHLFLKGRFFVQKRTEEGLRRGIEFFEQAIRLDPGYADPYAGLAECFSLLTHKGLEMPRNVMPKAKSAALKALALDGQVPEAHIALGFVRSTYDWEWEEAEDHYLQALQTNSHSKAEAHHWYASDFLTPLGRLDEALYHIQQSKYLDPLSHLTNSSLGFVRISRREYDEAIDHFRRCLEIEPDYYHFHTFLGRAFALKGDLDFALKCFERGRELSGDLPYVRGILAHCYGLMGREKEAEDILNGLLRLSKRRYVSSMTLALIYIGLNRFDEALRCIEKAYQVMEGPLVFLNIYPTYDPIRDHPRCQEMIRSMGLAK
jgi:TolB-like protein/tetratricopeptide (TPR) repeat protein